MLDFMAKRPRGQCRVCGRAWRGRWYADVLVVLAHTNESGRCEGSDLPAAGEPYRAGEPVPARAAVSAAKRPPEPRRPQRDLLRAPLNGARGLAQHLAQSVSG